MTERDAGPEKTFAFDVIARNRKALATLSDSIFYFGEVGLQEYETAALMTSLLEAEGFAVERGIAGFPTAFVATFGSGRPVVAVHTEYDANPENSQVSGVTERREIVPGAPGHCEGHNVNGAVLVTSAVAVKRTMERFGLKGTLEIFGAPAEEQLLSRPYFVRDGYFDDVDVAIHDHLGGEFKAVYGITHTALVSAKFIFHGEASHASTSPWRGRDALDGVVLMDIGMAQYREHMQPTMRAHRVITEGGLQPNVIPARAGVWWYFRDPTAEGAAKLFEQGKKIAEGAALMSNTSVEVEVLSAVWPVRANQTLAEILQRNIEIVGMPAWTGEEQAFARELQAKAAVPVEGLPVAITPLVGPAAQRAPSNDCGDISWAVPMGRFSFPANVPNVPAHHWSAGAALTTSIAHKGGEAGAKALSGALVDLFVDPALVAAAKATFAQELGGVKYRPLLPPGQKPPIATNTEMMDAWRPKMRAFYVKERPVFVA
jgi:aminobenzoyl-glutamate utilization protein B